MRTVPTKGIEAILGIEPLHLHINAVALNTRYRTQDTVKPTWDGLPKGSKKERCHIKKLDEMLESLLPGNYKKDSIKKARRNFDIKISLKDGITNVSNAINIYTDGSKSKSGIGCGWLASKNDTILGEGKYKISSHASVFQAELCAIAKALEWVRDCKEKDIHIFTDSQAALNALKSKFTKSETVRITWNTVRSLKGRSLVFHWIKGHNGHTGNEAADMLAKNGTNSNNLIDVAINTKFVKNKIVEHTQNLWQKEWPNCQLRHTKIFCKQVDINKTRRNYLLKLNKMQLKDLIEWITGHTLNKHLNKIGKTKNSTCSLCRNSEESPEHVIMDCPALETFRVTSQLFNEAFIQSNNSWRPGKEFFNETAIQAVLELIQHSQRRQ